MTIRLIVLVIIGLTTLLALRPVEKDTPATKESLDECCKRKCNPADDNNLIWQAFSRELIAASQ